MIDLFLKFLKIMIQTGLVCSWLTSACLLWQCKNNACRHIFISIFRVNAIDPSLILNKSVGSRFLAQALDSTALQKNTRLTYG